METKEFTLGYLFDRKKLLLTHRNMDESDFHYGMWVAPGGKLRPEEMAIEGMEREFFEETGLKPLNTRYRGVVRMDNEKRVKPNGDPFDFNATIFLFDATRYAGVEKKTDERGNPNYWVPTANIHSKHMHKADQIIWKLMRSGNIFEARFSYNKKKLVDQQVHVDEYNLYHEI